MLTFLQLALAVLSLPVAVAAGYLLLLTLLSGRRPPPAGPPPRLKFDLVVPAHDEEAGIVATVTSLLAVDYPAALRRVVVVADNCADATAARARQAGATVLERRDLERRGKGFALEHAFGWILADGFADAVVVVDADTVVSSNLLTAFATRLEAGAPAVQADNGVANPEASWRTCLMAIAFVLTNTVRMLGRERLGCSTGLRGNGMCLSVRALREVPQQAFSVVEDVEQGIRLGLAGHRVHYAYEAKVRSEMVTGEAASRVQRQRWEGGRRLMAQRHALPLIRQGLRQGDKVLLDLGLDLAVPPLANLAAMSLAGATAAGALGWALGHPPLVLLPWLASLLALLAYVVRGWWISGTGLSGLRALAFAPVYLAWKVGLGLQRRARAGQAWDRTPREGGRR